MLLDIPLMSCGVCTGAPPDTKPPPPLQRRLERKQGGIQRLARMVGRSHQVMRTPIKLQASNRREH